MTMKSTNTPDGYGETGVTPQAGTGSIVDKDFDAPETYDQLSETDLIDSSDREIEPITGEVNKDAYGTPDNFDSGQHYEEAAEPLTQEVGEAEVQPNQIHEDIDYIEMGNTENTGIDLDTDPSTAYDIAGKFNNVVESASNQITSFFDYTAPEPTTRLGTTQSQSMEDTFQSSSSLTRIANKLLG